MPTQIFLVDTLSQQFGLQFRPTHKGMVHVSVSHEVDCDVTVDMLRKVVKTKLFPQAADHAHVMLFHTCAEIKYPPERELHAHRVIKAKQSETFTAVLGKMSYPPRQYDLSSQLGDEVSEDTLRFIIAHFASLPNNSYLAETIRAEPASPNCNVAVVSRSKPALNEIMLGAHRRDGILRPLAVLPDQSGVQVGERVVQFRAAPLEILAKLQQCHKVLKILPTAMRNSEIAMDALEVDDENMLASIALEQRRMRKEMVATQAELKRLEASPEMESKNFVLHTLKATRVMKFGKQYRFGGHIYVALPPMLAEESEEETVTTYAHAEPEQPAPAAAAPANVAAAAAAAAPAAGV